MQNNSENGTSNQKYPEVVFLCSCGQGCKRIVVKDIVYIEAMKDNCRVYMSDSSRYHLTCPMKDIEDTLDPTRFIKPKSVIRISLCRTAKRNPLIFPI